MLSFSDYSLDFKVAMTDVSGKGDIEEAEVMLGNGRGDESRM